MYELFWQENYLIGILVVELALCISYEKRKYALLKWIVFAGFTLWIATFCLSNWEWENGAISMSNILGNIPGKVILSILIGIHIYVCYKIDVWNSIFCVTIGIAYQRMQFNFYKIMEELVTRLYRKPIIHMELIGLDLMILLLFSIILWLLYGRRRYQIRIKKDNKFVIILSMLALIMEDLFNLYLFARDPYASRGSTLIAFRLYDITFCLITFYMLFNLIGRKSLQFEQHMLETLNRQRSFQYAFSQEVIDNINIKSHDLKKQIQYLKKDKNNNQEFIKELEGIIEEYDTTFHTGNDTLNIILSEKSMVCRGKQIRFTCMADGSRIDFIKEIDIYTLFANLLDNAIESACQQAEDQRSIFLVIKSKENFLSIHEENFYSGNIKYMNRVLLTTKNDEIYHGFGIKSMIQIVEHYHGTLNWNTKNDMFSVNILIPIPEE